MRVPNIPIALICAIALTLACDKPKPTELVRDNPLDLENPVTEGDPYNIRLKSSDTYPVITWDEVELPGSTGYRLYKQIGAQVPALFVDLPESQTTWMDSLATYGQLYTYSVVSRIERGPDIFFAGLSLAKWAAPPRLSVVGMGVGGYVAENSIRLRIDATSANRIQVGRTPDLLAAPWMDYDGMFVDWELADGSGERKFYARVTYNAGDTSHVASFMLRVDKRPVAAAGADQHRLVGEPIELEATASTDPEGSSLTYRWRNALPGSAVTLSNTEGERITISASGAGRYPIELSVTDGRWTSSDTVMVEFSHRPSADAGEGGLYGVGEKVPLDGRGSSDEDGDALTYNWTVSEGGVLTNELTATPTFYAEMPGIYTIRLQVADGVWNSEVAQIQVEVDERPVAEAGPDQHRLVGEPIELEATASTDPEGSSLTYRWRNALPGSALTLSNTEGERITINASGAGRYPIELSVSDGRWTSSDTVMVEFSHRPSADAGEGGLYGVGEKVPLDGRGSSDEDGDALTYNWTVSEGGVLTNELTATPTFYAETAGIYTIGLQVADGVWNSEIDQIQVEVITNRRPLALVGADFVAAVGELVQLDGSGSSDPDDDALTYRWMVSGGVRLDDMTTAYPSFTALEPGIFTVDLIVSDGISESNTARLMITIVREGEITVDLLDNAQMTFVWIEPGTFMMGVRPVKTCRSCEWPQKQVTISRGYYLGQKEVTQDQWKTVMRTQPWLVSTTSKNSYPAVNVTWNGAQAFVAKLNAAAGDSLYRLPTEAEWEYAARAGTETRWSFGDDESQLDEYAWYEDSSFNGALRSAKPGGGKLANPWGLYDMHGNVWEWCQDWFSKDNGALDEPTAVDPMGPVSGSWHVKRGGSFTDMMLVTRSASRIGGRNGSINTGFRVVKIK